MPLRLESSFNALNSPTSPSAPSFPLYRRKTEMKFFNYEPITVNEKNMHYSRSHWITASNTPCPHPKPSLNPQFNLRSYDCQHIFFLVLSLFSISQYFCLPECLANLSDSVLPLTLFPLFWAEVNWVYYWRWSWPVIKIDNPTKSWSFMFMLQGLLTDLQCLPYENETNYSVIYRNDGYNMVRAVMWPFKSCPNGDPVSPLNHTHTNLDIFCFFLLFLLTV